MAVANAGSQPTASWDEEQNISALAHLERLQEQLNELRMTIPRVLTPFYSPPTPALYREFKDGLLASQVEIKSFRNKFQGQETQGIIDHARRRVKADGDMSKSGEVQQYGWIERKERRGENAKKGPGIDVAAHVEPALTDEEIGKIVGEWRARNERVGVVEKDGGRDLLITFVVSGQTLNFHVTIVSDANEPHRLRAECVGSTDVHSTITKCIASRPTANDLKFLLDMIAAYKTVKGTTCAKCGKSYDADSVRPLARRVKRGSAAAEGSEVVWEALHESCLD